MLYGDHMLITTLILIIIAQLIVIGLCFNKFEEKDKENMKLKAQIRLMHSKLKNLLDTFKL